MLSYKILVRQGSGAFRYLCTADFASDDEARCFGRELLGLCGGVDIWRGDERIVLIDGAST